MSAEAFARIEGEKETYKTEVFSPIEDRGFDFSGHGFGVEVQVKSVCNYG